MTSKIGLTRDRMIGRGATAAVYDMGDTVAKLTIDHESHEIYGHWAIRDSIHKPRNVHSWGKVGEYNENHGFYLFEMEKLKRLSPGMPNYNIVRLIEGSFHSIYRRYRYNIPFGSLIVQMYEEIGSKMPASLADYMLDVSKFADDRGIRIDVTVANFMQRPSTGEIVFVDPVFNHVRLAGG